MLQQAGRVVAIEPGAVWVESVRQSACNACSARAGCGQRVLASVGRAHHVRALTHLSLNVGDPVVLEVPEHLVVKSTLILYLIPLLAVLAVVSVSQTLALAEGYAILGSVLALGVSFFAVRLFMRRREQSPDTAAQYMPRVVQRLGPSVDTACKIDFP